MQIVQNQNLYKIAIATPRMREKKNSIEQDYLLEKYILSAII